MLANEIVRRLRAGESSPELLKAAADKLDNHLGVGFAAFQDGTFELFIRSNEGEWHHEGKWEDEKQLEQMRKVFADCAIVRATRGVDARPA